MKGGNHNSLNFAVSMTLFAVFSLFLTLVLLMGASSFKSISGAVEERYEQRTLLLYVSQKIRMCDSSDSVRIIEVDGNSTLVVNDGGLETYIFFKNDSLNELYCFAGDQPDFSLAAQVLPAESADFEEVFPSLIKVTIGEKSTYINLSSE